MPDLFDKKNRQDKFAVGFASIIQVNETWRAGINKKQSSLIFLMGLEIKECYKGSIITLVYQMKNKHLSMR